MDENQFLDSCRMPCHWWEFFGEAYGQAIEAANRKHRIQAALKRLGGKDVDLVAHMISYGDGYEERGGPYTNRTTLLAVLEEIDCERYLELEDVLDWATLRSTYYEACESEWGRLDQLLTNEESDSYEREEKRKAMESFAGQFAHSHNVGVNSMEFIHAIHVELGRVRDQQEHWNSGEARMERMGACIAELGSAYGSEIFFDDNNFENGRFGEHTTTLSDLLDWLGEACPLLMAQYAESELAGQAEELEAV